MGQNATVRYHVKQEERDNFLKNLLKKNKEKDPFSGIKDATPEMLDFFRYLRKKTKLFDDFNYVSALKCLWNKREHFIEEYKNWKPKHKNRRKQFSTLARFLLTKYKIPTFMDNAWFYGREDSIEQRLFIELCQGKNIRKCEGIPIPLTKKQAHYFSQAPENYTVHDAFRYGQIIGMGGSERLVEQVILKLGNTYYHSFWDNLIWIYINNPMLDVHSFGQIVDYVNSRRQEQRDWSFKGRTAESLLRQSEEWHQQVRKIKETHSLNWEPLDKIELFKKEEGLLGRQSYKEWKIIELLSSKELAREGNNMGHCVRSYASSCKHGNSSIWSLRCNGEAKVTIEVHPRTLRIVQAQGPGNKKPKQHEWNYIVEWASQNKITYRINKF